MDCGKSQKRIQQANLLLRQGYNIRSVRVILVVANFSQLVRADECVILRFVSRESSLLFRHIQCFRSVLVCVKLRRPVISSTSSACFTSIESIARRLDLRGSRGVDNPLVDCFI
jgi:hypothetical protein